MATASLSSWWCHLTSALPSSKKSCMMPVRPLNSPVAITSFPLCRPCRPLGTVCNKFSTPFNLKLNLNLKINYYHSLLLFFLLVILYYLKQISVVLPLVVFSPR